MAKKFWTNERYWKDQDIAPCYTQSESGNTEMETLAEKIELSKRVVDKSIYLMEQIHKAIELPQDHETIRPKMLSFLLKSVNALTRFCNFFEFCHRSELVTDNSLSLKYQIVIAIDEVLFFLKLIKRCIGIFQSARNARAQNSCYGICKKINSKFEKYLVDIKYWFSDLPNEELELFTTMADSTVNDFALKRVLEVREVHYEVSRLVEVLQHTDELVNAALKLTVVPESDFIVLNKQIGELKPRIGRLENLVLRIEEDNNINLPTKFKPLNTGTA